MRILIAGAGAIGGLLGAKIVGHDVTLLGRQALADAVAANGLNIRGLSSGTSSPRVITKPAGEYDLIILTCKAHQTSGLVPQLVPLLAPAGIFASMQNGLGNGEKIAAHIPADRIVICLTSHGVTLESPGNLIHAGTGATKIGPVPGAPTSRAAVVKGVLDGAGLAAELCLEMRGQIWFKAIINAGINPLAAMHGVSNGALLAEPLWDTSWALAGEAATVATAAGVQLPEADVAGTLRMVCKATATNHCSMLQDVTNRRPTEIDQIIGRILSTAAIHGVACPESEKIYVAIKALEASYLGAKAAAMAAHEARLEFSV